jgi:hypothetical protein
MFRHDGIEPGIPGVDEKGDTLSCCVVTLAPCDVAVAGAISADDSLLVLLTIGEAMSMLVLLTIGEAMSAASRGT